ASAREGRGSVVVNVSSDAAINAYANWGAYGASKAALRHLTSIWDEEARADGVRFLSIDPGDMDTPLHALAVPDADRSSLRAPADAARELADAIADALPAPASPDAAGPARITPALARLRPPARSSARATRVCSSSIRQVASLTRRAPAGSIFCIGAI